MFVCVCVSLRCSGPGAAAEEQMQAREQKVVTQMIGQVLAKTPQPVHPPRQEGPPSLQDVEFDAGRDSHGSMRTAAGPPAGIQVNGSNVSAAAAAAHSELDKVRRSLPICASVWHQKQITTPFTRPKFCIQNCVWY